MYRLVPFVEGEVYHIFNRGAHKQDVFLDAQDYERFLLLLHLANHIGPLNLRDLLHKHRGRTFADIYSEEKRDKSLVDILAYALMPNHYHLVLRQKAEEGVTVFLKRVLVGYSMYFNLKHDHSGVLFQGPFKSSHIDTEAYFRYIFAYVHLNPLDLIEPGWKEKGISDHAAVKNFVTTYPYSSFFDYHNHERPQAAVLALSETPDFLKSQNDLEDLIRWQQIGEELIPNTKVSSL